MIILLDEEAFDKLTSGKIIEQGEIKIALSDIGYARMIEILEAKLDKLYVGKTATNDRS